jgi:hypothetical protein
VPLFPYFFDKQTLRPNWAGDVEIELESLPLSAVPSDLRSRDPQTRPRVVDVPVTVEGVILPVSTGGRTTEDVPERVLHYFPMDRGHLMALSLGGPDVPEQMVVQPRAMNQWVSTGDSTRRWRALEIFLAYAALRIMNLREEDVPNRGWWSCFFGCCRRRTDVVANARAIFNTRGRVQFSQGLGFSVGGYHLDFPSLSDYSRNGRYGLMPRLVLKYKARRYGWRDNAPTRVLVTATVVDTEEGRLQPCVSQSFEWEDTPEDQQALINAVETSREEREALLASSALFRTKLRSSSISSSSKKPY